MLNLSSRIPQTDRSRALFFDLQIEAGRQCAQIALLTNKTGKNYMIAAK
jgi:hypothetical protein